MNLFDAIKALFRKEEITSPVPSDFMLHRFLASQKDFAPFCKEINLHVYDRDMVWVIWKTALPRAARAPYLPYPAPKSKKDDEFTTQLADRMNISLTEAEDIVELIDLADKREEVSSYYGIE